MDLKLTGKVAIVTGGSRGLGKVAARELAREGMQVVVVARSTDLLEASAKELAAETGRPVLAVPADVTDEQSVAAMVDRVVREFGRVDVLVNSVAPQNRQGGSFPVEHSTFDQLKSELDVKLLGYLRCTRAVVPHMKQQGWGRIVNLSGLAARESASAVASIRNVSVVALTKNLASELGPYGINVTVIHPGIVRTERTAERAQREGVPLEEFERRVGRSSSIGRILTAEEIAHVIAFLASPLSIAINGDLIAVGGGTKGVIYY